MYGLYQIFHAFVFQAFFRSIFIYHSNKLHYTFFSICVLALWTASKYAIRMIRRFNKQTTYLWEVFVQILILYNILCKENGMFPENV